MVRFAEVVNDVGAYQTNFLSISLFFIKSGFFRIFYKKI